MVTRRRTGRGRLQQPEPRNRDATRERILAAVGALLAREGFSGLGVNAVARAAGVDKVLIYRYFGGIEALLDAWGQETLGEASAGRPAAREAQAVPGAAPESAARRASEALLGFARAARANPQALEIQRWELFEENALTRRLARLRESAGLVELARLQVAEDHRDGADLPAIAALLSAGLLHLALRARTASRWLEIPIRTRQGWERLERAASLLVEAALAEGGRTP